MSIQAFIWSSVESRFQSILTDDLRSIQVDDSSQIWLDVTNPGEEDYRFLVERFGIDESTLVDFKQNSPHPRMHSFKKHDYILLHRVFYSFETQVCENRAVAIFRAKNFLITLHRSNLSRLFDYLSGLVSGHPEAFLSKGNARVYLHLMEGLVADYGPVLNQWQENLEEIEESILRGSSEPVTERILKFKKLVVTMRKSLIPQRQTLIQVYERTQLEDHEESIRPFLKDVSEEVSSLLRELEGLSSQAASIFEIYAANLTLDMSRSTHQLNVVMQRLSVMTAIFLPLTFIVGVYGMNIEGIPELRWPGFYFFLWGVMVVIVAVLLFVFKKFKWY